MKTIAALILGTLVTAVGYAEDLSETQIQAAIERGKDSSAKKIWDGIRKKQQVRINRAGFDPIEKKVTFLSVEDRIALEAAEASRQLRAVNIAWIKGALASPVTEVLLEASCYNNTYRASLPKWGPDGGVHLVPEVNGQLVQPLGSEAGTGDAVSLSTIYERESLRTWFVFPEIPSGASVKVIVISGDGKRKEKEIDHWR